MSSSSPASHNAPGALDAQHGPSLAMVIASDELRLDTYAAAMIQSFTRACQRVRCTPVLLLAGTSDRGELVARLAAAPVAGSLVFAPSLGDELAYEILDTEQRPVIFVGRTRPGIHQPSVDVENTQSCAKLVGHLLDTAGPRVAMIAGAPGRFSSELRLKGFRLAHEERGIPIDESLIVHGDYTRLSGYRLARVLLPLRPEAIFTANDEMGLGAVMAASEAGIEIPRDVSLAGFDGSSAVRVDEPRLTSAHQQFDQLATMAVECLLKRIGGESAQTVQLLEPRLHFGWSTHVAAVS